MCVYPRIIKNKKYTANKKNGGVIPAVFDDRVLHVPVACGDCIECRKAKAREWQIRLTEDIKNNKNGVFVTLTFTNDSIRRLNKMIGKHQGYARDNAIAKKGVRMFLERWRKKYKKSVRHWLVTELGGNGTENVHLHGIIWTDNAEDISKIWQYGYVWAGDEKNGKKQNYVNGQTINYIVKYINKIDEKHKTYKSKVLTTPGIGGDYITRNAASKDNKYRGDETKDYYKNTDGTKQALPIYYRNKLYSDREREELWINKIEKQERWVLGQRIDVSNGVGQYNRALKAAQKFNKSMGYGSGKKKWEQWEYENQLRDVMNGKRMKAKDGALPQTPSNSAGLG